MTYNPYPQQQDPNYGYQQPYQPYQQTYAAQPYPAYVAPPPKKDKTRLIVIIVVVLVVIFIVVPVVIAGILVVYMQGFSSGPGVTTPTASMVAVPFTNSYDGSGTQNGGGWSVQVISVSSSKAKLSDVSVSIKHNNLAVTTLSSVSTKSASLSYTAGGAGKMQWYLLRDSGIALKYIYSGTPTNLDATTAKNLDANGFSTVQGAYLIFVDQNGDSYLNAGDLILVYADYNADKINEINSGFSVSLSMTGSTIASASLS